MARDRQNRMREAYALCVRCQHAEFPVAGSEMILCRSPDQTDCAYKRIMRELEKELDVPVRDV